jgi:cytochrome P450
MTSRAKFQKFTYQRLQERRQFGSQRKDLFTVLLGEEDGNGTKLNMGQLHAECSTAIIAGSDSTASAIAFAWYYLARDQDKCARLRAEIDGLFPDGELPADTTRLANQAPYLNAVINEAMRLYPPIPSSMQRTTPSDGLAVLDEYVPPGTMIGVPTYTVHRDARYFPRPDEFWPERWLEESKSDGVLNKNAYMPFSTGPVSKEGKIKININADPCEFCCN